MQTIDQLIERSKLNIKQAAALVPVKEDGEPLVSQTTLEKLGLVCKPFWEQADDLEGRCYQAYIASHPQFDLCLRQTVAHRLLRVQSQLPNEWTLVLKAGYRPPSVQLALLDALKTDIKTRNPAMSDSQALENARQYVADPTLGCPPHTTGGAVDVDIVHSRTHTAIDMGCPPNTDDDRAALHSNLITEEQCSNRQVLLKAMLQAGFAPLHNEWWHYSYGETRWAVFYRQPQTLYGIISD